MFQADESGKFTEGAVPADMAAAVDAAREALIEMVAEADEKLMEKFFEAGTLTDEELLSGLRGATMAGKIFPLVCTSALLNIGVQQLLDAILAYLPSPADRPFSGVGKDGSRGHALRGRQGGCGRLRLEDHRRSVRRPHHHVPRRLRIAQVRFDRATTRRGTPVNVSATCCCCRARRRRACRRSKPATWAPSRN